MPWMETPVMELHRLLQPSGGRRWPTGRMRASFRESNPMCKPACAIVVHTILGLYTLHTACAVSHSAGGDEFLQGQEGDLQHAAAAAEILMATVAVSP